MILLSMKFELAFTAVPLNADTFNHSCWFCTYFLREPNCSTRVYVGGHFNLFRNKSQVDQRDSTGLPFSFWYNLDYIHVRVCFVSPIVDKILVCIEPKKLNKQQQKTSEMATKKSHKMILFTNSWNC